MSPKIPYLGHRPRHEKRWRAGGRERDRYRSFTYIGTSVMAGPGPHTPSHNARDALCMLHTLLTIRKITVGSAPAPPSRLSSHERVRASMRGASARVSSSARESQLERESAPIDSIESSPEDHIFIATLSFVPPTASSSASSPVSTLRCARRFDFCYRSRAGN